MRTRLEELQDWLTNTLALNIQIIDKLPGDASFRQYYRITGHFPEKQSQAFIAMDAPPSHEKNHEFFIIDQLLESKHVRVPKIFGSNLEDGFMLLEDFGHLHFFEVLNPENKCTYYQKAIDVIHQIQSPHPQESKLAIASFSKNYMRQELALFTEWFLKVHLKLMLDQQEMQLIQDCFDFLVNTIDEQPKTLIHRDFHSRNLMILSDGNIGVIDFQDAMIGPRAYDLVSLLKDCYIEHSASFQAFGLDYFNAPDPLRFEYEYQVLGVQRHLKVLGIFARLYHRDGKSRYLNDLPLVLQYTSQGLSHIPELSFFHRWLKDVVYHAFNEKVHS